MHPAALRFVCAAAAQLPPDVAVYDIGSRNINGSARQAFPFAKAYLGIDLVAGQDVDIVGDATLYTPPFVPDVVVCCEVLEHTYAAGVLCERAWSLLAPRGTLIASLAGPTRAPHSALDGGPLLLGEFYRNGTSALITEWCHAFIDVGISTSAERDDLYVIAHKG